MSLIQLVSRLNGSPYEIDAYVRGVFQYLTEPYEIIHTPENSYEQIEKNGYFIGDCDDAATFVATLLRIAGFTVRFVVIRTDKKTNNFQHVYVEFFDGHHWYSVDPTVASGTDHKYLERRSLTI